MSVGVSAVRVRELARVPHQQFQLQQRMKQQGVIGFSSISNMRGKGTSSSIAASAVGGGRHSAAAAGQYRAARAAGAAFAASAARDTRVVAVLTWVWALFMLLCSLILMCLSSSRP